MARRVFFSFNYKRDVFRVNQIRGMPNIIGCAAAGFQDGSLWEKTKKKGDAAIKKLIDEGLKNTSVTIVCVGAVTTGRKYINYEIKQSIDRGNGIIAVRINHLKGSNGKPDGAGSIPSLITKNKYPVYKYSNKDALAKWIEKAAKDAGK